MTQTANGALLPPSNESGANLSNFLCEHTLCIPDIEVCIGVGVCSCLRMHVCVWICVSGGNEVFAKEIENTETAYCSSGNYKLRTQTTLSDGSNAVIQSLPSP